MTEKAGAAMQTALEPTQVKVVEPQTMLERFNKLSEQISRRAYEIFEGTGNVFGRDLENWFKAESEILHPVHLRVAEKDGAVSVEAEVPGFTAKELEVSLEGAPPYHQRQEGNHGRKEKGQDDLSRAMLRAASARDRFAGGSRQRKSLRHPEKRSAGNQYSHGGEGFARGPASRNQGGLKEPPQPRSQTRVRIRKMRPRVLLSNFNTR